MTGEEISRDLASPGEVRSRDRPSTMAGMRTQAILQESDSRSRATNEGPNGWARWWAANTITPLFIAVICGMRSIAACGTDANAQSTYSLHSLGANALLVITSDTVDHQSGARRGSSWRERQDREH